MKTQLKKVLITGLAVLSVGWLAGKAQAASTDTITISVTPNATFGVTISSPYASGYNFGLVNLNSTTLSTLAITLANTGSIYEYFGISVSNTSGGWTASSALPSTDTFRMSGQLSATQPAQGSGNFSALTNTAPRCGDLVRPGQHEDLTGLGFQHTETVAGLEMPFTLNTGGTGAQTMTVSVTGQGV